MLVADLDRPAVHPERLWVTVSLCLLDGLAARRSSDVNRSIAASRTSRPAMSSLNAAANAAIIHQDDDGLPFDQRETTRRGCAYVGVWRWHD
jgi:hypothetical protein